MAEEILLVKASRHKIVIIYGLADPRDQVIRYIGKAEDPPQRLRGHVSEARHGKGAKAEWIRDLLAAGVRPAIRELEAVPIGSSWAAAERRQVASHKAMGLILLNRTEGGEGVPDAARTPESIARAVAARKANPEFLRKIRENGAARRGKPLPPETRAKIGDALRGRKLPPEQCEKLSRAQRGRAAHPNSTAGARLARLGKRDSEATKAKKRRAMAAHRETQSDRQRQHWLDPEFRDRVTKNMRGKSIPASVRQKIGEASRAGWADKGIRDRRTEGLRAALQSDDYREKRRVIARRLWSDPEFRDRMKRARKK